MGCFSNVPKPVFVETNLGTRLAAVPVSPDVTTKEFKRELGRTHLSCFPEIGRIRVNALMVKRKSHFYHLSESLPLKYAFLDSNGTWFLQMDAQQHHVPPNHMESSSLNCHNSTQVGKNLNSADNVSIELSPMICTEHKRKKVEIRSCFPFLKAALLKIHAIVHRVPKRKKKRKKNRKRKTKANWTTKRAETLNETLFSESESVSVSVSGIIKKYFPDYDDEVATTPFSTTVEMSRHQSSKYLNSSTGEYKYTKPQVGKRVLMASDNLGLTPNNQRPTLSFLSSSRKSPFRAVVRDLVFEMTEESD